MSTPHAAETTIDRAALDAAVEIAAGVVDRAVRHLAATGGPDVHQQVAYDVAHVAAQVEAARVMLDYATKGPVESKLAAAFVADMIRDMISRVSGREAAWGSEGNPMSAAHGVLAAYGDPQFLATLHDQAGPRHLDDDFELVQDTFRAFAAKEIAPHAEHVHRTNADVPEKIITGLAEIGAFGLSVPAEYGGFNEGGPGEYMAMVVATEELSRASLGIGGSLITRPEIITRALVKGGTEAQKQEWLPKLATAEVFAAVAVTEPDYGSDVAGVKVTATPGDGPNGDPGYVINGVKTWCTFAARADVLMLLARTDPDAPGHRGLSVFIVPKPRGEGHGFAFTQEGTGGTMEGRAIDTIGYRGMHSYEVAFDSWWVPADHLIGEEGGRGRGFYLQMEGFENGRLQTAARAVGVMQAAFEAAGEYAANRKVFGANIVEYQLTQVKLARMAVLIQAGRQFAYRVAEAMANAAGDPVAMAAASTKASMVKAYVCKAAEWVTREAMQIHGGMGYAEEFPVSRLFVDARVLSIFEGADETLCLKVISRRLAPLTP